MEIANLIAGNAPIGIQVTKEAALKYIEAGEKAAIDYIPSIKDRVFSSEDMKEGIQSFVERRSVPRQIEYPAEPHIRTSPASLRERLFFIWKRLPTYWNCWRAFGAFFPNAP
jgi:hypothetical protein